MGYIVFLSLALSAIIGGLVTQTSNGALIGFAACLFGIFVGVTFQEIDQKKQKGRY